MVNLGKNRDMSSMIRVNHAGESGAVQIYKGQLAILKNPAVRSQIQEMLAHEEEHLKAFDALMKEHKARPTVLSPLFPKC